MAIVLFIVFACVKIKVFTFKIFTFKFFTFKVLAFNTYKFWSISLFYVSTSDFHYIPKLDKYYIAIYASLISSQTLRMYSKMFVLSQTLRMYSKIQLLSQTMIKVLKKTKTMIMIKSLKLVNCDRNFYSVTILCPCSVSRNNFLY